MGDEADAMDLWEMSALGAERFGDRKAERAFRAARPTKDQPCIIPGCAKKFRPSTQYEDFLTHYRSKHGKQS